MQDSTSQHCSLIPTHGRLNVSAMSSLTSALERYRPVLLAVTAIAAGCAICYVHITVSDPRSSSSSAGANVLRRSNAQRRRRASRVAVSAPGSNTGADLVPADDRITDVIDMSSLQRPASLQAGENDASSSGQPPMEEGRETIVDVESEHSWRDETTSADGHVTGDREAQNYLHLLYRIAEETARKDGYVHRRVTCNSCNMTPIRGIRYRCANCADYDLCEMCESRQIHNKMHLFYKIRIPAPFINSPRERQPVWYPGKPGSTVHHLPKELLTKYLEETQFQRSELEALWEQFRCLAGTQWATDPDKYELAIDRVAFDKCFAPHMSSRPPPPNLILDRMFEFYDTNHDGLIGFGEFVKGLSCLTKMSVQERCKKLFDGYDINGDGYVDRKDFLRMFRAFYALTKEMTRDVIESMDEEQRSELGVDMEGRQIVASSQPVSAAFVGHYQPGERWYRTGEGKMRDENGDDVVRDEGPTIRECPEDTGDKNEAVADLAESVAYGPDARGPFSEATIEEIFEEESTDIWPPVNATIHDVIHALHRSVPVEEIEDSDERQKVRGVMIRRLINTARSQQDVRDRGVHHRWQRQQFYLDEEDGALPPVGFEQDETVETQPPSRRSRSSSKVRFQDDLATDDDHETRSATSMSSRSIPVGESWGGYEVPEAEKYVGREILYQVAQESLNELLDPVFLQREDLAILARCTKRERELHRSQIDSFATDAMRAIVKSLTDSLQQKWRLHSSVRPTEEDFLVGYLSENSMLSPDGAKAIAGAIDFAIQQGPSSYSVETFSAETSSQTITTEEPPNSQIEYDSHLDPTLPQHRPNSIPSTTPLLPSLPEERLRFLLAMDIIEAEDAERGGPGRISLEEFVELWMGKKGQQLKFVGSWIEMASF